MAKDNSAQVAQLFDEIRDQRDAARAEAQECRAERARYGDAMTERLAGVEAERNALRDEYRLLVERVKAVMPYAVNTASWVTLLATIGVEPEDMHFSK